MNPATVNLFLARGVYMWCPICRSHYHWRALSLYTALVLMSVFFTDIALTGFVFTLPKFLFGAAGLTAALSLFYIDSVHMHHIDYNDKTHRVVFY